MNARHGLRHVAGALRLALLCIATMLAVPAMAAVETVDVEGTGHTRDDAIQAGLVNAIQQVTGVAVAQTAVSQTASTMAKSDTAASFSHTSEYAAATGEVSHGVVQDYQILDVAAVPLGFTVHLRVSVAKYDATTANTDRRRIAVAPFADTAGSRGDGARLRDAISAALTQSRRFAVLDRANAGAYAAEMGIANTAPLAEQVRAGQVMMTDYIVTGTLRATAGTSSERVIGLTGEHVITATAGAVEADFQVIDFATRQVKLAGKVQLGGSSAAAIDQIAARIAEQITQAIYPMRLINADDPTALIINQGGETVRPGQRYRAMQLGAMMVDPYTKEQLGQAEREIGQVEITRVDEKMSYARLVAGQLPPAGSDVVLRPAPAPPPRAAAPARPAPAPVIKLPGDP